MLLIKRSQNFIDLQERRRGSSPVQPIQRTFPPRRVTYEGPIEGRVAAGVWIQPIERMRLTNQLREDGSADDMSAAWLAAVGLEPKPAATRPLWDGCPPLGANLWTCPLLTGIVLGYSQNITDYNLKIGSNINSTQVKRPDQCKSSFFYMF